MNNLKKLETEKGNQKSKKRKRKKGRFLDVDVWQKVFSEISEKAVYAIFMERFQIDKNEMNKYSFSHCVYALRKLEDPNYIPPEGN